MAFSMFLSLFPFLIFVTAMAALAIGMQDVDATLAFMFDALPPDVAGVLEPVVSDTVHARVSGAPLTLSLVGALWVASNGIEALRAALRPRTGPGSIGGFRASGWSSRLLWPASF